MAAKKSGRTERIACFTEEQQAFYETLNERQRKYIKFRGQGYGKTQSYRMAGYDNKNAGTAAFLLEDRNKGIRELCEVLRNSNKAKSVLTGEGSRVTDQINALAEQKNTEEMLAKIEGMSGEEAKRLQFYRDIANGSIKTVRKTKRYNAEGGLIETKIEEVSDIEVRIKARKELDRILGLQEMIDIGKISMGDITINIVDASKREELADSRNNVVLDLDKVEEIEGETVIVTEEKDEGKPKEAAVDADIPSESDKFFDRAGDE